MTDNARHVRSRDQRSAWSSSLKPQSDDESLKDYNIKVLNSEKWSGCVELYELIEAMWRSEREGLGAVFQKDTTSATVADVVLECRSKVFVWRNETIKGRE
nr:hypothetical protein CFP56_20473 [Quercus suber]